MIITESAPIARLTPGKFGAITKASFGCRSPGFPVTCFSFVFLGAWGAGRAGSEKAHRGLRGPRASGSRPPGPRSGRRGSAPRGLGWTPALGGLGTPREAKSALGGPVGGSSAAGRPGPALGGRSGVSTETGCGAWGAGEPPGGSPKLLSRLGLSFLVNFAWQMSPSLPEPSQGTHISLSAEGLTGLVTGSRKGTAGLRQ